MYTEGTTYPQSISPTVKTMGFGAKKVRNTNALIAKSAPMTTCLWPNFATRYPLRSVPKKLPAPDALPTPACQAGVS